MALIRLLRIRDLLERLLLVLALGMSIAALAAEAIAIGHVMQPARVLAVLAVICSCAALIELTREKSADHDEPGSHPPVSFDLAGSA